MKTSKLYYIAVALIPMLIAGKSFGQEIKADTLPTVVITGKSNVTKKVDASFKRMFNVVLSPKWYELDRNYLVKFIMNDQKNSALFDKNGRLIYHIRYGSAADMPEDALDLLKRRYVGSNIKAAIHVDQDTRSVWLVDLEHRNYMVLARVEGNELTEIRRMKKVSAD